MRYPAGNSPSSAGCANRSEYEKSTSSSAATRSPTNAPSTRGPQTASTPCTDSRSASSTAAGCTSRGRKRNNSKSSHKSPWWPDSNKKWPFRAANRFRTSSCKPFPQTSSNMELAKEGNAGLHQVEVHFDEVILEPARFCRRKDLRPVERALPHRHCFLGYRRPVLHMHRNEAPRVLRKVLGGVVAPADRRHLELELDQLRIEQIEQQVIGPLAAHHGELEPLIVKTLLDAGLGRLLAHLVVFLGGPLHIVHSRVPRPVQTGHHHLRQAEIVCPGNSAREILPQLPDVEVRALALDPQIAEHSAQLGPFVFGETGEAGVGVTHRRAQFDRLKTDLGKLLDGAGKVLGDHIPDGIGLASDWHAQRIGAQLPCARGQAPEARDDERDDDGRTGVERRGVAGYDEYPRPDDGADAQAHQVQGGQALVQLVAVSGLGMQLGNRLRSEKVHGVPGFMADSGGQSRLMD